MFLIRKVPPCYFEEKVLAMQREVVEALMKPEAYDEEVDQIELIQTHISFVFLTREGEEGCGPRVSRLHNP